MKKTLEQILSDITYGVKTGIQKSNLEYQKKLRENIHKNISYCQEEMVNDLFYVFSTGNYPAIKNIGSFQNIRPDGWFARGNKVLFRYRLLKESCGHVSGVILDSIRDNMNADLNLAQKTAFCSCGMDIYTIYPYLAYGVKVLHVLNTEAEIIIVLTANINFLSK